MSFIIYHLYTYFSRNFTRTGQSYFTVSQAIIWFPFASEVTQNDLGKKISQYLSQQNITKGQDVHNS